MIFPFRILFPAVICISFGLLYGWGFNAHKTINREAAHLLSDELGIYFVFHSDYLSEHSIDPDLWRRDKVNHPNEGRGHYIDADLYDVFPFSDIPRTLDALIQKYGEKNINQWGTSPWRIESFYQKLIDQFKAEKWEDAKLTAAVLGHYVSDIHMPLHVVENYNGQLSGNRGIHKRWEADMVDAFLLNKVNPKGDLQMVKDPVDVAFRIVVESFPLHTVLLKADSLARRELPMESHKRIADRDQSMDGTGYIEILFKESGWLAKDRMELASVRVASFWHSAWVEAGKPKPPQKTQINSQ